MILRVILRDYCVKRAYLTPSSEECEELIEAVSQSEVTEEAADVFYFLAVKLRQHQVSYPTSMPNLSSEQEESPVVEEMQSQALLRLKYQQSASLIKF